MQISAETMEPSGAAIPIGIRVRGKQTLAIHVPGILVVMLENTV